MYIKLAYRNMKRSVGDYLVYMVTMTICATLFYAFLSITSRYYNPDIGTEYDFTSVNGGMKMAVCGITLLLLFLIRYVNNYMLNRKQKEFAVQSVMGMEQKIISWIFFTETFCMGMMAVVIGIFLGVFGSQFITGMLLSAYGKHYRLSWMLFPDTVIWTLVFFAFSLLAVGLFNIRTIRRIKIIDMLYADRQNEPHIGKSRYMHVVTALYTVMLLLMTATGISQKYFYSDPRFPYPVHVMFWGNIVVPACAVLLNIAWCVFHKKWDFRLFIFIAAVFSLINICFVASVPVIQRKYYLSNGPGALNSYLVFLLADVIFLINCVIYLAAHLITEWKEKSLNHKYRGSSLFFFGQIISKLGTTSKTMTLICLTFVLSVILFVAGPALTGWSSGYLDDRSMYDIQISSRYNSVYEEADLPEGDYELVTSFLKDRDIKAVYDCAFNLYLPRRDEFDNRIKLDFPVVVISLSDYNALREMLGYGRISLEENEFTTQWKTIATVEERDEFLREHTAVSTDMGTLTLADNGFYEESMGETVYNAYTDVLYVFPDSVCRNLLAVMRNRYIRTETTIPYEDALALEAAFEQVYPETPDGAGNRYYIRTSTHQINSVIANNFVLQAAMIYSAVVLMIICLTILSLQQLSDTVHVRYRFGVLHKLGVDGQETEKLIIKQLAVWFGLPVVTAVLISVIIVVYFFEMISAQIAAYVGWGNLLSQVGIMVCILGILLGCYFVSTWMLFRRAVME